MGGPCLRFARHLLRHADGDCRVVDVDGAVRVAGLHILFESTDAVASQAEHEARLLAEDLERGADPLAALVALRGHARANTGSQKLRVQLSLLYETYIQTRGCTPATLPVTGKQAPSNPMIGACAACWRGRTDQRLADRTSPYRSFSTHGNVGPMMSHMSRSMVP